MSETPGVSGCLTKTRLRVAAAVAILYGVTSTTMYVAGFQDLTAGQAFATQARIAVQEPRFKAAVSFPSSLPPPTIVLHKSEGYESTVGDEDGEHDDDDDDDDEEEEEEEEEKTEDTEDGGGNDASASQDKGKLDSKQKPVSSDLRTGWKPTNKPSAQCRTFETGSEGWKSTVLHFKNVHLLRKQDTTFVITVGDENVRAIKDQINACNVDGYIKKNPNFEVRGAAMPCTGVGKTSILVDEEHWGNYYHSIVDQIVPWFITSELLGMTSARPELQFYASAPSPVKKNAKTLQRLKTHTECLGLRLERPVVSVNAGCYASASVGFLYQYRPVHYFTSITEFTFVPELNNWLKKAANCLRTCENKALSSTAQPLPPSNVRWTLVRRTSSQEPSRVIQVSGTPPASVQHKLDTDQISWTTTRGLIAVEGATFTNQLFMPPGSTIIQLHVPRKGRVTQEVEVQKAPTIWHTSIAAYLGHTSIDILLSSNVIDWARLAPVLKAAEQIDPGTRCTSHDMQLPLKCAAFSPK
jgi:hypothetical protein